MNKRKRISAAVTAALLAVAGLVAIPQAARADDPDQQIVVAALDAVRTATGILTEAADVADLVPALPFTDARPGDLLRSLADKIPTSSGLAHPHDLVLALERIDGPVADHTRLTVGCPAGLDDNCSNAVKIHVPDGQDPQLRLDLPIDVERADAPTRLVVPTQPDANDVLASPDRGIHSSLSFTTTLHLRRDYPATTADGTWLEGDTPGSAPTIDIGGSFSLPAGQPPVHLRLGIVDLDAAVVSDAGDGNPTHVTNGAVVQARLMLADPNGDGRLTRGEWESVRPQDLVKPREPVVANGALKLALTTPTLAAGPSTTLRVAGNYDNGSFVPSITSGGLGDFSQFDVLRADSLQDAVAKLAAILRTAGSVGGHGLPFLGSAAGFSGNLADAAGLATKLTNVLDAQSVACRDDGGDVVPPNTPLPAGTILRCRAAVTRQLANGTTPRWRISGDNVPGPTNGTVSPTPFSDMLVTLPTDGVPDVSVQYADSVGNHVAGLAAASIQQLQNLLTQNGVPVQLRWAGAHKAVVADLDAAAPGVDTSVPLAIGDLLGQSGQTTGLRTGLSELTVPRAHPADPEPNVVDVRLDDPQLHVGLGLVMDPGVHDADRLVLVPNANGPLMHIGNAAITAPPTGLSGRVGFLRVGASLSNFAITSSNALNVALKPNPAPAIASWPSAWPIAQLVQHPADALDATVALHAVGDLSVRGEGCTGGADCLSAISGAIHLDWPNVTTGAPAITATSDWSGFDSFRNADTAAILNAILDQFDALANYLGSPALNARIPLLGRSVADVVGDVSTISTNLAELRGATPGHSAASTLQTLGEQISTAFHLPRGAVTLTADGGIVKIKFALAVPHTDIALALAASVGDGSTALRFDGGVLHVTPDGSINFEADVPLANPLAASLGGAGVSATLHANAPDLHGVQAGFGPIHVDLGGGEAHVAAALTIDTDHGAVIAPAPDATSCGLVTNNQMSTPLEAGLACIRVDLGSFGQLGVVVPSLDQAPHVVGPSSFSFDTLDFSTLLDGFDALTRVLAPALHGARPLPVIGKAVDGTGQLLTQLNAKAAALRGSLANLGGSPKAVKEALETATGNPATVLCTSGDCSTDADPNHLLSITDVQVHFVAHDTSNKDAAFGLGMPGFPLATAQGTVEVKAGWDADITVGVSRVDGPYLVFPGTGALRVGTAATIGNLSRPIGEASPCQSTGAMDDKLPSYSADRCLTGRLGLLSVALADKDGSPQVDPNALDCPAEPHGTYVAVCASLRVEGASAASDGSVRVPLSALAANTVRPVASITGGANLDMRFRTGIKGADGLPSLVGRLAGHWDASNAPAVSQGPVPPPVSLSLDNLYVDPGTAVSGLLGPVLSSLNDVVSPVIPVFDLLQAPLPVLSQLHDLAGDAVPANLMGLLGSDTQDLVKSVAGIAIAARTHTGPSTNVPLIGLGPVTDSHHPELAEPGSLSIDTDHALTVPASPNDPRLAPTDDPDHPQSLRQCGVTQELLPDGAPDDCAPPGDGPPPGDVIHTVTTPGACPSGDLPDALGVEGLSFPVLENPTGLVGLLLGQDVDLVTYNPRCLDPDPIGIHHGVTVPVGPVPVTFSAGISLDVFAHFGISYDTAGLRALPSQGLAGLVKGLSLDDLHGDPTDPPELHAEASLTGSAAVDAFFASAGIEGGVGLAADLNLHDPNNDGKVRFDELSADPACWFDTQFSAFYFLRAFFEIFYFIGSDRWNFDIVPRHDVPLASFSCGAAPPLATDVFGSSPHELRLNTAGYHSFAVRPIHGGLRVSSGAHTKDFSGAFGIVTAEGTGADESFEMASSPDGTTLPTTFNVTFHGNGGNDTLVGSDGDDHLIGGAGNDHIDGNGGDDVIFGDDNPPVGNSGDDVIYGGPGHDTIYAGPGADIANGGAGPDDIFGGEGNDHLNGATDSLPASTEVDVDHLVGGEGNDVLDGGPGDDWLVGGTVEQLGASGICAAVDAPHPPDPSETSPDRDGNREGIDDIPGGFVKAPPADNDDIGFEPGLAPNDDEQPATDDHFEDPTDPHGNDTLVGGAGDDTLVGEQGDDTLVGGPGNDNLCGGAGVDHLEGDDVHDLSVAGDDELEAGPGDDTVDAGPGFDDVEGGEGRDNISAGAGRDVVFGDGGDIYRDAKGRTEARQVADGDLVLTDLFNRMRSVGTPGSHDDDPEYVVPGDPGPTPPASACPSNLPKLTRCASGGDGGPGYAQPSGPCSPYGPYPFDDCIDGGDGDDFLFGGPGNDQIEGGAGNDGLFGQYDDDVLRGGAGADHLWGDEGNDTLRGGADVDQLQGGPSDDHLYGDDGNDIMFAGGGDDVLDGGNGNDTYHGGADEDTLVNSAGADYFDGGDSTDTVSYAAAATGVTVTVGDQAVGVIPGNDGATGEGDNVGSTVEIVIGSSFDDTMDGLATAAELHGGPGKDSLTAGTPGATLYGDDANDILTGGPNTDRLHGGKGNDTLDGRSGNDFLYGDADDDTLRGGPGPQNPVVIDRDDISGGSGIDTVDYSRRDAAVSVTLDDAANDGTTLFDRSRRCTKPGRLTRVTICVTGPNVVVAAENDNVHSDVENVVGGAGADTITGSAADNRLDGGPGGDTIRGGDGNDTVNGGTDNDTLYGDGGADAIDGGPQIDACHADSSDRVVVNCETGFLNRLLGLLPAKPPGNKPPTRPVISAVTTVLKLAVGLIRRILP